MPEVRLKYIRMEQEHEKWLNLLFFLNERLLPIAIAALVAALLVGILAFKMSKKNNK